MSYDYDADILATMWTGTEEGEEPYASLLSSYPSLANEDSEKRILSTIELFRAHVEMLASRDEARALHFAIVRMLGGGVGNIFTDSRTVAEGNVPNPKFKPGASISVTTDGAGTFPVTTATGTTLQVAIPEMNVALAPASLTAYITRDRRLGIRSTASGVSFSLSNGTGGIVGPAGIIPGLRKHPMLRLADERRDIALSSLI